MPDRLFFPAIVADFDGTIRHAPEGQTFINRADDVRLYEGVIDALWEYREQSHLVFGLTNQGGVAFGHKTVVDVSSEVQEMRRIAEERGQRWPFHDWYAACRMEGGTVKKFDARSLTRKPRYGGLSILAHETRKAHGLYVDWDRSLMVGDSEEDLQLARAAGIDFLHAEFFRGLETGSHEKMRVPPDSEAPWNEIRP